MKVGDVVEFDDEHGNKKRGVIEKINEDEDFSVLIKYESHIWFSECEVKVIDVVERLGDLS